MSLFSRSFWKDLAVTYAAEIAVIVCSFLAPGIVARWGSLNDLGLYLLLRRVASSLLSPLSLGLGVALSRFLPMRSAVPGVQVRWSMLGIGAATVFTTAAMLALVGWRQPVMRLLVGNPTLEAFAVPLALLVVGNVVHFLLYNHYRGMMQMNAANVLQAINLGVVPVLALLQLRSAGLAACITLTGLGTLGVSAAFLLPLLRSLARTRSPATAGWFAEAGQSLFGYGLGRVPGFIFAGLLLTVGSVWLAHRTTLTDVAMFALGLSFIRMVGAFFGPIGVLVLPRLSSALASQQKDAIRQDLASLVRAAVLFALFASLQAATLSRSLLEVWLGSVPEAGRQFFVPLTLVLPFYLTYEVLRNPIDAVSAIPYNSIALGCALLALGAGLLGGSSQWLVASQLLAFVLLGGISLLVLRRLYRLDLGRPRLWLPASLLSVAAVPVTWLVQKWFYGHFALIAIYETVLFALFLSTLGLPVRALAKARPRIAWAGSRRAAVSRASSNICP